MNRAEELASELQVALTNIQHELEGIAEERWNAAVTAAEGWRVGHTAHHIAEGYLISLGWIERALAEGKPVTLTPAVDLPAIHVTNARCLQDHGNEPREATLAFLSSSARRLVDRVRTLTDAQLEAPMMVVMGEERSGSAVALPMALRHATNHLQSIRGAG